MDSLKQRRLDRLKGVQTAIEPESPTSKQDARYQYECKQAEYWGWPIPTREEWDQEWREYINRYHNGKD